ncbi:MAG TPA: CARDB domain-containing protein, partial [Phycisphaerae bacterium]|nr:CARDB domain-containing protein [Phycisphaerae bacterium]
IDHSLTMGMRGGGGGGAGGGGGVGGVGGAKGTLFEQGVDVAEAISKMLPASGTMSIILAEHTPKVITPTPLNMGPMNRAANGSPVGTWGTELKNLRQMKPGMTLGNIPAAVAQAREQLSHGYNFKKVIIVVSDEQRTNWEPGDESAWRGAMGNVDATSDRLGSMQLFEYPIKPPDDAAGGSNVSVRAVVVRPDFLGVHRPAQILATVANSGGIALTSVPVKLEVDGKVITTQMVPSLAAGDSTTVRFDFYFPEAGSHWVRVSADLVDTLEADNAAVTAVNVKPKLPVLVVDGQLTGGSFPAAAFLLAAMQPVDPSIDSVALIEPKVISASELATPKGFRLEDYPIVVLNDVPRLTRELVDKLAEHAQAGNGVWIILGPRTEQTFLNDVLGKSTLAPLTTKGIAKAPQPAGGGLGEIAKPVTIDIKEPGNPAVTLMTHGGQSEHQALADATLRQWWQITPSNEMHTVLATTTGDPLVAELNTGKLGGAVVVWTSPTSMLSWNNLALVPNFVPLVNETLFHLASGQDAGQPRQVDAGQPLTWTGPNSLQIETAVVIAPDGTQKVLQPELRGDHYFVEERETSLPGLYEMRFSAPAKMGATPPKPVYFGVNVDRQELDPAVLSVADQDWFRGKGYLKDLLKEETLPKAMEAKEGGRDLWWMLGLLLLAFLLLEVFLTRQLVREQSGQTLADEGLSMPQATGGVR